jgi:hypothetical protein
MWEPQPLATRRASTACTGITLPYEKENNTNKGENPEDGRHEGEAEDSKLGGTTLRFFSYFLKKKKICLVVILRTVK